MIVLAILLCVFAIGALCWLLFHLAVFALPLYAGAAAAFWAHGTGAGWFGAVIVGLIAGVLTLMLGVVLLALIRAVWLRLAILGLFVAPAAVAGFHATHGIVQHLIPSPAWQIAFSTLGAIAVAATTFVRLSALAAAPPDQSGQGLAQA